jgi:cephalosporin hydroxylase
MYQINGCPVPIYQDEGELKRLVELVKKLKPKCILEIGSLYGGTMWYWMNVANGAKIVSVDIGVGCPDSRHTEIEHARLNLWPEWEKETGCTITQIQADSTSPDTVEEIRKHAPFDFVFIDGGHTFDIAMSDWNNYWPMLRAGGFLAFHDIAYPDINSEGVGVGIVWRKVRDNGKWQEFIREHNPEQWMGIGVIWKHSEEQTWQLEQD